jgi:hypothetical protein
MKESPYKGKTLDFDEIFHIFQVLKFYYQDLETLAPAAIAEIMQMEFGCIVSKKDVYLYLFTVQFTEASRDSEGNIMCHD